jgi:hypothetical protein
MTLHVLSSIHHLESFTVATTIWSFLHHRVTRGTPRMSQVEQELLTFPDHLCTFTPPPFIVGFVFLDSIFCEIFCKSVFVLFHLAIVLCDLLRFTDSDNLFGIFKIVLQSTK